MNSITKRWVRGSLLVTILMCLVAEAVFLYYSITNYYDGARRAMTTRTSTIITQLNASAAQTGESQGVLLRRMERIIWRRWPAKRARATRCTARPWAKR